MSTGTQGLGYEVLRLVIEQWFGIAGRQRLCVLVVVRLVSTCLRARSGMFETYFSFTTPTHCPSPLYPLSCTIARRCVTNAFILFHTSDLFNDRLWILYTFICPHIHPYIPYTHIPIHPYTHTHTPIHPTYIYPYHHSSMSMTLLCICSSLRFAKRLFSKSDTLVGNEVGYWWQWMCVCVCVCVVYSGEM